MYKPYFEETKKLNKDDTVLGYTMGLVESELNEGYNYFPGKPTPIIRAIKTVLDLNLPPYKGTGDAIMFDLVEGIFNYHYNYEQHPDTDEFDQFNLAKEKTINMLNEMVNSLKGYGNKIKNLKPGNRNI